MPFRQAQATVPETNLPPTSKSQTHIKGSQALFATEKSKAAQSLPTFKFKVKKPSMRFI
jgi:hypothetical protein